MPQKNGKNEQTFHRRGNIYGKLIYEEVFSIINDQENFYQYHSNMHIDLAKILTSDYTSHEDMDLQDTALMKV